jgi:hypothetical protein
MKRSEKKTIQFRSDKNILRESQGLMFHRNQKFETRIFLKIFTGKEINF